MLIDQYIFISGYPFVLADMIGGNGYQEPML
jgi:hypothetical protein